MGCRAAILTKNLTSEFYLCSTLKKKIYKNNTLTTEGLQINIITCDEFAIMSQNELDGVMLNELRRVQLFTDAQGRHFKQLLCITLHACFSYYNCI